MYDYVFITTTISTTLFTMHTEYNNSVSGSAKLVVSFFAQIATKETKR